MNDLARVARVLRIYAQASSANDYCLRLTHDAELGLGLLGTQLFSISTKGNLDLLGSYGIDAFDPSTNYSLFEDNPISKAINQRNLWIGSRTANGIELRIWVLPLLRGEVPVGAATCVSNPEVEIVPFSEDAVAVASNAGALYLDSLGVNSKVREKPKSEEGKLTDRQYVILLGMARGETNAEIAKQLILSESSIKQETVRIFRALGVGSRQQAVAKAKATGLLPQLVLQQSQ